MRFPNLHILPLCSFIWFKHVLLRYSMRLTHSLRLWSGQSVFSNESEVYACIVSNLSAAIDLTLEEGNTFWVGSVRDSPVLYSRIYFLVLQLHTFSATSSFLLGKEGRVTLLFSLPIKHTWGCQGSSSPKTYKGCSYREHNTCNPNHNLNLTMKSIRGK